MKMSGCSCTRNIVATRLTDEIQCVDSTGGMLSPLPNKRNSPSPNKFVALQHPFPLQNGLEGRKIQAKGIVARTRRRQNDLLLFVVAAGRRHRRFTLAHTGFHSNGSIVEFTAWCEIYK